jgi:hypothetical protein
LLTNADLHIGRPGDVTEEAFLDAKLVGAGERIARNRLSIDCDRQGQADEHGQTTRHDALLKNANDVSSISTGGTNHTAQRQFREIIPDAQSIRDDG